MTEPPVLASRKPRRRTQAERRAFTRSKIVSAALEALSVDGYTPMTIADVAHRAGVSRGALLHYFPQKTDLALAAIAEGEAIVLARLHALVAEARERPDRDELILDALYEIFSGAAFQAFLALQVHARTEPALNAQLHTIVEHATEQMGAIAAEGWGPEVARAEGFPVVIAVILGTVRGLVLIADISTPYNAQVWPAARALLASAVQQLRE